MFEYAQTITQLYRQLDARGCKRDDLLLVADAYDLAVDLFAGMLHPSGKMFIDHCIGTASVLAANDKTAPVIAAGILHNVYQRGQFGDETTQATPAKRREVTRRMGEAIESYVYEFAQQRWWPNTIPQMVHDAANWLPVQRIGAVIHMSDLLDLHEEGALLYADNREHFVSRARDVGGDVVAIARILGETKLAADLEKAFADLLSTEVPEEMMTGRRISFTLLPRGYRTWAQRVCPRFLRRRLMRVPAQPFTLR